MLEWRRALSTWNKNSKNEIDNDQFNSQFIPLFSSKRFMEQFVRENFENIRMRIKYEELLTLNVYLVAVVQAILFNILQANF